LRELKKDDRDIEECPVTPQHLASMLKMIKDGVISGKIAKTVFEEMYRSGKGPEKIVQEKGLVQLTDSGEIQRVIQGVLEENPKLVEDYRKGKEQLLGFFVGQVMKATRGKANPKVVNELLRESLSKG
jgi:aspartyl-tRNA(Asn)/glutamyl-tRNA(Gln) amidotransferase subunit B